MVESGLAASGYNYILIDDGCTLAGVAPRNTNEFTPLRTLTRTQSRAPTRATVLKARCYREVCGEPAQER